MEDKKTDKTMKFTSKQDKILDIIAYTTKTYTQIAKENGITRQTLYNWRKNPEFMEELEKRTNEATKVVEDTFKRNVKQAHDTLLDIMLNSDDERTSLDAAKYYLNRVMGTPMNKIENTSTVSVTSEVDDEDILAAFDKIEEEEE